MQRQIYFTLLFLAPLCGFSQERALPRATGLKIGVLPPGRMNAITDVPGVKIGHETLIKGDSIRTGVTAIIPQPGNIFQMKLPAAIFSVQSVNALVGETNDGYLNDIRGRHVSKAEVLNAIRKAFSTAASIRIPHQPQSPVIAAGYLHNDFTSQLFMAAIEATEEAIINSLFAAKPMPGRSFGGGITPR